MRPWLFCQDPALPGVARHVWSGIWSVVGMVVGGGILWGLAEVGRMVLKKDAMGFGDVKLLGAIGAFLGTKAVLFTLVASSLLGSIVGIALVLAKQKKMQSRIPYGPYLALAAVIWIYWGHAIWEAYKNFAIPAPLVY